MTDPRLAEWIEILGDAAPKRRDPDDPFIEDEDAFHRRFGIGFRWPRGHRKSLLDLKRDLDLTDGEIRQLRYGGNLRRTAAGVHLYASRWNAAVGWLLISLFSFVFGMPIVFAVFDRAFSAAQAWMVAKCALVLASLCGPI